MSKYVDRIGLTAMQSSLLAAFTVFLKIPKLTVYRISKKNLKVLRKALRPKKCRP